MDQQALAIGLAVGLGIVGLLVGLLLGRRRGAGQAARVTALESELSSSKQELESYRSEVSDHFDETSRLLRDLTIQYRTVYEHLAEGARQLNPEGAVLLDTALAEAALPAVASELEPILDEAIADEAVADEAVVAADEEVAGAIESPDALSRTADEGASDDVAAADTEPERVGAEDAPPVAEDAEIAALPEEPTRPSA